MLLQKGCRWPKSIVFHEFLAGNPDSARAEPQTGNGIYEAGGGHDNVYLSWGHDEYIYQPLIDKYLPAVIAW